MTTRETVAALLFALGISVVAYQVFLFLKIGSWVSISFIYAAGFFTDSQWLIYPYSWSGIWKVLDFLPVSVSLIAASLLVAATE